MKRKSKTLEQRIAELQLKQSKKVEADNLRKTIADAKVKLRQIRKVK